MVSRPMVMLTAIGVEHTERRRGRMDGKLSDGSKGVTNSDAKKKKKKSPAKNTEKNRSKNIFPQRRKRAASPFWLVYFRGLFISSSWEKWQLKFHWGEIEGGLTVSRVQLCLKGEKKEQLLLGTSLWHAWICHRASVPSPESTDAHRKLLLHSRQHGRAWGGRCEWNKKQNLIGMVSLP